jgi:hypothetical protein
MMSLMAYWTKDIVTLECGSGTLAATLFRVHLLFKVYGYSTVLKW